ncbi:hypothetical protein GMORB2_4346 [Geosmithia morbida]|uniref:Myb/SANT-like domain-containing protein n=1 Tax=Geosmithia morbida TaxID=1094350 RepID=A0A9P5D6D6_9HYPO|nr:uncharacterized protein GMORB2_4346 [Geosmithia morbida]KAF4125506.1 hypothetical protein GMORB2_4346 [Geosmithia morbida]
MSEDDLDNLGTGPAVDPARAERDRRAPRFSWTPAYEATFFRSLCDSVGLGLRENSSFKAEAWERAAVSLQATHGAFPTKSHLINKSDNARKRFRLWRGLREDPEFLYNPATRTVTATEEAWKQHIEREPLSRALRGRPFEHEDYMEILYPDVIGSGGAPKRIVKPRRKTDGSIVDDSDMPGAYIMPIPTNLQMGMSSPNPSQNPRPTLGSTPTGPSTGSVPVHQQHQHQQPVPPVPSTLAPPPPSMATTSSSALTPPDETVSHQRRKRRQGASDPSGVDLDLSPPLTGAAVPSTTPSTTGLSPNNKRRRTSSRPGVGWPTSTPLLASSTETPNPAAAAGQSRDNSAPLVQAPLLEEILEAIRSHAVPRWREQALDIFFRDFSAEELDLQVKISENVLSNENKAMVFCKMPDPVRQHWVGKFREMHQHNKTS